jgi:PAS domain S-box-containing protein
MALLALKARPMPTTLWVIVFTSVTSWLLIQQRNTLDPINVQFVRIALRTATLLIGGVATVLLSIHRRRLFQSHEHLLGVLRKIPAPLVLSNSSGTVIFVNEQAASMLGLAPEEAEGLSYFALFVNRSDKGNAIKHYLEMVEQEEQTASSIELRLRDRPEVPMKGTLVPLASGGDRWIITLISARQDAENQTLEGITAPVHP